MPCCLIGLHRRLVSSVPPSLQPDGYWGNDLKNSSRSDCLLLLIYDHDDHLLCQARKRAIVFLHRKYDSSFLLGLFPPAQTPIQNASQ
jgi:hypothetical protein